MQALRIALYAWIFIAQISAYAADDKAIEKCPSEIMEFANINPSGLGMDFYYPNGIYRGKLLWENTANAGLQAEPGSPREQLFGHTYFIFATTTNEGVKINLYDAISCEKRGAILGHNFYFIAP